MAQVNDNINHLSTQYNDGIPVQVVTRYVGIAVEGEYAHLPRAGIMINADFLRLPGVIFQEMAANIVEDYHMERAVNQTMMVEPVQPKRVVPPTVGERDRWRKGDYRQGRVGKHCLICLQDFRSNQVIKRIHNHPNCTFHRDCIDRWFEEKPRCPACNLEVESYAANEV